MGMGRNIFRREAVIFALGWYFLALLPPLSSAEASRPPGGPLPAAPDRKRAHESTGSWRARPAAQAVCSDCFIGDPADGGEALADWPQVLPARLAAPVRARLYSIGLPLPDDPAVAAWRQRILSREKQDLEAALERAGSFRRLISRFLAERGLPQELIWLPVLESHYRVRAVSRSGACGLWQITASTARALGLNSDRWVDERRDFWKSTAAALQKLAENYACFGNWDLALAAYNCGLGRMSRIVRTGGTADFWELRQRGLLPQETASYVPKFYALVSICSDPLGHGLQVSWTEAPEWQRIPLERSVELALLAEAAGLSPELLAEANAELRTPITPPAASRPRAASRPQAGGSGSEEVSEGEQRSAGDRGGEPGVYLLKVPAASVERVREILTDPQLRLLRYGYHCIQSGDTLYALSGYYGVGVDLLIQANPGLDPRRLQIGGQLRIPVFGSREVKPEPVRRCGGAGLASFTGSYTVKVGDTLWAISRQYGTTVEALAEANGRGLDELLKPGETLRVPAELPRREGGEQ
jgi:membrane-bound lytic murein transglycosylase D